MSGVFRDPLTKQCKEGVRIKNAGKLANIMYSKSERNHPPTNRITIQKYSLNLFISPPEVIKARVNGSYSTVKL